MRALMALDLELNQPSGKTIQVGACVFRLNDGHIFDSFVCYVNPNEQISKEITALTDITQAQVENFGFSPREAYQELKKFAQKNKVFQNPVVWGSGSWNDSHHLYQEAGVANKNFMGHRVWDTKTLYQMFRAVNGLTVKGGLDKAMQELNIVKQGKSHDALWDAINTARVFFHLSKLLKLDPKALGQQAL